MDNKALIKIIEEGKYTPEQIEQLNTSVRMALASSLVQSVKNLEATESKIQAVMGRLTDSLLSKIEANIEAGSSTIEDSMKQLALLHNITVSAAETKRKIFNGKEMFNLNPISDRERALLDLFKAIDSDVKRQALENYIRGLQSDVVNAAEEAEVVEVEKTDSASADEFDE